jgi:hypothetical protein
MDSNTDQQIIVGPIDDLGSFAWTPAARVPDEHIAGLTRAALAVTSLLSLFLLDRLERGCSGITEKAFSEFCKELIEAHEQEAG